MVNAVLANLEYARTDTGPLTLDLYLPDAAPRPLPIVLYLHGGAWRNGDKQNPPTAFLVTAGYAVASVNYRLSGEARFPSQIADARAAVRWLRANAALYSLDPKRVAAFGVSAGGHLAALLGTAAYVTELDGDHRTGDVSCGVRAVVDFFGPTEFLTAEGRVSEDPESLLLGGPPREKPDAARLASPITHIRPDAPPFLIVHGDRDAAVPLLQSELLYGALMVAGVSASLVVVPGAGHGFTPDQRRDMEGRVLSFLDGHLTPVGA